MIFTVSWYLAAGSTLHLEQVVNSVEVGGHPADKYRTLRFQGRGIGDGVSGAELGLRFEVSFRVTNVKWKLLPVFPKERVTTAHTRESRNTQQIDRDQHKSIENDRNRWG